MVGLPEHRGVVVRIPGRDHPVIERLERGDGAAFLVGQAQAVAGDAVVLHHEAVAPDRGPAHLAQERLGELLEGVREDDDLGLRAEGREKLGRARQQREPGDDLLDPRQGDPVPVQDGDAFAHQLVVVRLLAGGAPEGGNAGGLGDCDPDLGREDALHIEGDDALLHGRTLR